MKNTNTIIELFQIYLRKYVCYGARKVSRHRSRYCNECREGACDRKRRERSGGSMEVYGIQSRETL